MKKLSVMAVCICLVGVTFAEQNTPSEMPKTVRKFLNNMSGSWEIKSVWDGQFNMTGKIDSAWDAGKNTLIANGRYQYENNSGSWSSIWHWDGKTEDGVILHWSGSGTEGVAYGSIRGKIVSPTLMEGKQLNILSGVKVTANIRVEFQNSNRLTWARTNRVADGEKKPDEFDIQTRVKDSEVRKQRRSVEQASPQSIMRRMVGNWVWQGEQVDIESDASPYGQGGRFAGGSQCRLVADGKFLLTEWHEKSPEGNILKGVSVEGYDKDKKCFVTSDFMSDGSTSTETYTIQGRIRKSQIIIQAKTGEEILARVKGEYSEDWKRIESKWEVSLDKGKTWKHWAKIVSEKTTGLPHKTRTVREGSELTKANDTTRNDFEEFSHKLKGRWICDIKWATDWPGGVEKGSTDTAYIENTISDDGNALNIRFIAGKASGTALFGYDSVAQLIRGFRISGGGSVTRISIRKKDEAWLIAVVGSEPDGTKVSLNVTGKFSNDGNTYTEIGRGKRGDESVEFKDVWRRLGE